MDLDNKISFFSGFMLTTLWSMPLYDLFMGLFLGIVGGFGGMIGKWIWRKLEK